MTSALFLAVVLSCAGDPAPGTLDVAPPPAPPAVVQIVEVAKLDAVEVEILETLEPDVERPRPRPEPKRRILLELLVTALEVVINR